MFTENTLERVVIQVPGSTGVVSAHLVTHLGGPRSDAASLTEEETEFQRV